MPIFSTTCVQDYHFTFLTWSQMSSPHLVIPLIMQWMTCSQQLQQRAKNKSPSTRLLPSYAPSRYPTHTIWTPSMIPQCLSGCPQLRIPLRQQLDTMLATLWHQPPLITSRRPSKQGTERRRDISEHREWCLGLCRQQGVECTLHIEATGILLTILAETSVLTNGANCI